MTGHSEELVDQEQLLLDLTSGQRVTTSSFSDRELLLLFYFTEEPVRCGPSNRLLHPELLVSPGVGYARHTVRRRRKCTQLDILRLEMVIITQPIIICKLISSWNRYFMREGRVEQRTNGGSGTSLSSTKSQPPNIYI